MAMCSRAATEREYRIFVYTWSFMIGTWMVRGVFASALCASSSSARADSTASRLGRTNWPAMPAAETQCADLHVRVVSHYEAIPDPDKANDAQWLYVTARFSHAGARES